MLRVRPLAIGAAALSATALLLVPVSASGHTDNLYTWGYTSDTQAGFATTSKTDATMTLLPTSTLDDLEGFTGMEICDDQGYAVTNDGDARLVLWDHTTGALTGATPLSITPGPGLFEIEYVQELDTLADCSLLTLLFYSDVDNNELAAVASIDATTGLVTPVAPITFSFNQGGLATDAAGTTYLFADTDDTQFAVVDLAAGMVGPLTNMAGIRARFQSANFSYAADFDSAGALWIVVGIDAQQQYNLLSLPTGSDLASTQPATSGVLPYEGTPPFIDEPIPLTADHGGPAIIPAAPTLPETGTELPMGLALTALLVLGAGAVLTVTGRRRAA